MGHVRTFWTAAQRAKIHKGTLVLRNEDLDEQRCRADFYTAMLDDLHWLGISWTEGPDCRGPFAPYSQSERRKEYLAAWKKLCDGGFIYPCTCSRKDLAQSATAPHEEAAAHDEDDEPLYPGTCRERTDAGSFSQPAGVNWRFRVPDEWITFDDVHFGAQKFCSGKDFGDFVVWRRDDVPAYQLAVVVDDAAMQITEVVRGADLLKSTARQILLYHALNLHTPQFYHCDLLRDDSGVRLAKRHDALSVQHLRKLGWTPEQVIEGAQKDTPPK